MHVPVAESGGEQAEGVSCVQAAVGVRDGDLDPQSPS